MSMRYFFHALKTFLMFVTFRLFKIGKKKGEGREKYELLC